MTDLCHGSPRPVTETPHATCRCRRTSEARSPRRKLHAMMGSSRSATARRQIPIEPVTVGRNGQTGRPLRATALKAKNLSGDRPVSIPKTFPRCSRPSSWRAFQSSSVQVVQQAQSVDEVHLDLGLKAAARANILASLERERKRARILSEVCQR